MPLFGLSKKTKTRTSGSARTKESAVLSEMKEISIITISETIFRWQVLLEEVPVKTEMELCISDQPTDFAILLPAIFWKNDKLPKPLLEK